MKYFWSFLVALFFVGCSTSPSIQEYYVSKSEDPSFLILDIPTSILGIEENSLSEEEQEALSSFQKVNVLLFRKTEEISDKFDAELATVRHIMDNKDFESLLVLNDKQYSGKLVFEGTVDRPDEIIFFGSADQGFVIARLIGRKMQVDKAMLLANIIQRENGFEKATKALGRIF